jgi:tight adherence protein B
MRTSRRLVYVLLAALVVAAPAAAAVRVTGVDTSGYPELRVTVVAPPGSPRPRLWADDRAVSGLRTVNLGHRKSVVLAVDRSRSMKGKALTDAAAGARTFVADKNAGDRVMVISFGHEAVALTRFTAASVDANAALGQLAADPMIGTALWDSIVLGAQRLKQEDQPGHVIIVLTDGHDVSSVSSFADAVTAAHAAHASVYPIAVAGPDFTPGPLRDLARSTGGSYHQTSSSSGLAAVYAQISAELARTWELTYPTAARPGDDVRLTASVPGVGRAERTLSLPMLGSTISTPAQPSKLVPRSFWASPIAPLVIAAIVALLVALAAAFWAASREGLWLRARLDPHLGPVRQAAKLHRKRERRARLGRLSGSIEVAMANVKHFRALERLIERADVPVRAPELLYIGFGLGFVFGLFAAVAFASPLPILIALAAGVAAPIAWVYLKAGKRLKAFDNQLPDLLITIAASLKAGHSFRQGIQSVVEEGAMPASKEFKRVLAETQLGRPMDEALSEMSDRVGSKNLAFVITAVTIQRQIGGSLAGRFDMVADTVRQRQQFARKIRGLTAMGRASAWVLIGLPFLLAAVVTALNPSYMSPLYTTSTGQQLIMVGLTMMAFGTLVLKKIVQFKG